MWYWLVRAFLVEYFAGMVLLASSGYYGRSSNWPLSLALPCVLSVGLARI